MPRAQVAHLLPLNQNLAPDASLPKLNLSIGPNFIGRHNIPVADKRLSRKHISLTTSHDGSAVLLVEGTNPVVVRSGEERKKLRSRESSVLRSGDIIEFIPGTHFFIYVSSSVDSKRTSEGVDNDSEKSRGKKIRSEILEKVELKDKNEEDYSCGIRKFNVSDDKLPLTFRLLRVKELPGWANTNCLSIGDVIQGDILLCILSNYMVDVDWLMSACPKIGKIPNVLVIHGEGDQTVEMMKRSKPSNWILHKPPLPISFGTHHSKAMFLLYRRGVRVIIHTANLIYVDWNNKSQGLWMQDFPWKDEDKSTKGSAFENDLIDYLSALKWPEFIANLPTLGNFNINAAFFRKFDYKNAAVSSLFVCRFPLWYSPMGDFPFYDIFTGVTVSYCFQVRLVASVPGYHTGSNLKKWGHMKLRTILEECTFDKEFRRAPLVYQFSSLGSLDEKWMAELASSMSSGYSEDKTPLGLGEPLIVWPTVEDVRCSLEGYGAGNAIPSSLKNVEKNFLKSYWAKWKATHTGRSHAMPHIKTFARYSGQELAWFLLTSANLSKAAWGALQKNNSQLMIRSYELGVLFLPTTVQQQGYGFSCTSGGSPSKVNGGSIGSCETKTTKLVTLAWQGKRTPEVIPLPVPYELPPERYSPQDVAWSWDRRYTKKDVYGQVWPRQVQLYSFQES